MATFTMVLKDVIDLTDNNIGLDSYPVFDESYRGPLNAKIIDHYFNREIGQETIDMFQLAMRRKMNEIMPYYNQLYKSELLKVDPFLTFSSESESVGRAKSDTEAENTSTATSESGSVGKSRTVSSETPQQRLAGDNDYATAAQDAVSDTTATSNAQDAVNSTQTGTQSNEGRSQSSGFSGAQSELLMQYRNTFLNIDMMVIEELGTLFMLLWSTGESYSHGAYGYGY